MSFEAGPVGVRNALRFYFRGGEVALDRFSPRATVLDWLREEMGAKGTKEGCAEGDCGACTVALARLKGGRLAYEPFNACILLLGQLDGAELITVEDLAAGGELHPLQQAMVDYHASQCGFCTPGIVMSLFAAYHSGAPQTYAGLCDQLAGNLCRCTGYRPILAAALETCNGAPADRFAATAGERAAALTALADGRDLFVGDEAAFFAAPASLDSLAALYARFPDATLVSGATDVGLMDHQAIARPEARDLAWQGRRVGRRRRRRRGRAQARGGRDVDGRRAAARRDSPRPGRVAAPLRLGAGAGERNGRRQYRQRLADRRSGAGPDRAWRKGSSAQGRRDPRAAAGRLLHRLWQAGSRPGRVRRCGRGAAARRRSALPRLQGVEALRRGHFGGHARGAPRSRGPAHRRRARRLRRHGGDAEARRERRAGADRREPRPASELARGAAPRCRGTSRRSPTSAPAPPIA